MDIKFKNICLNAAKSFELVDKLKLLRDEFIQMKEKKEELIDENREEESSKLERIKQEKKTEIERLCIELKSSVETINNKKSLNLIKTKLNKRKNAQQTSKCVFYHNEIENLLQNKDLFWENNHSNTLKNTTNPDKISSLDSKIAHQLDQLNSQLNDLKKIRELLVVYLKLITIRAQHKQIESTNSNVNKLNELLNQIDDRKSNYENEKRKLKEEIKLANLNSIKYEQMKNKENLNRNLNRIENSIKSYLFGPIRNLNEVDSFELYQRQAESSIENLILIRQEWDNFVSETSRAESLPVDWVLMDKLSNDNEWANFAIINN